MINCTHTNDINHIIGAFALQERNLFSSSIAKIRLNKFLSYDINTSKIDLHQSF